MITSLAFYCFSLAFPLTLFLILLAKLEKKINLNTKGLPLPPGPKPWPIIGNLPEMLKNRPTFRWIHKVIDEMNSEIICIRLGNVHVILVTSPEIGCEFLKQHDIIFQSRPLSLTSEILSGGYLTTAVNPSGDQWKKMRKIFNLHVVSPARHRWFQDKRDEESDHLVHYVYNKCKTGGGLVDMRIVTQHYVGNVIRKITFGKRFFGKGAEDGGPGLEEEEHIRAIMTALHYLFSFSISDFVPFLRGYVDLDGRGKIMRMACTSLRKYQDPIIEERIRQWKDGQKKDLDDLLDVFITLKDENGDPLLCADEIKAQSMELMIAAVDNPSNAVEWALAEMLNQPETINKALEELDRVVGNSRLVQESDIPQLNYIKACIKESFRIHPINPFNVPHVSDSDTTVGNYFIPKGSHVMLSRSGLGRNPRIWPEPMQFRPDRHLGDWGVSLIDPDLRILSFSTGRRGCVGSQLGSTMTVMLLARLLHGFSYSFQPGVAKIELEEAPNSMELAKPLVVMVKPRLTEELYRGL